MGYFGRNSKQHAADLQRDKEAQERARANRDAQHQQTLAERDSKSSELETGAKDGHLNEDASSDKEAHERAAHENRKGVDYTIDPDVGLSDAERHARVSPSHYTFKKHVDGSLMCDASAPENANTLF